MHPSLFATWGFQPNSSTSILTTGRWPLWFAGFMEWVISVLISLHGITTKMHNQLLDYVNVTTITNSMKWWPTTGITNFGITNKLIHTEALGQVRGGHEGWLGEVGCSRYVSLLRITLVIFDQHFRQTRMPSAASFVERCASILVSCCWIQFATYVICKCSCTIARLTFNGHCSECMSCNQHRTNASLIWSPPKICVLMALQFSFPYTV